MICLIHFIRIIHLIPIITLIHLMHIMIICVIHLIPIITLIHLIHIIIICVIHLIRKILIPEILVKITSIFIYFNVFHIMLEMLGWIMTAITEGWITTAFFGVYRWIEHNGFQSKSFTVKMIVPISL
eukprot:587193_1